MVRGPNGRRHRYVPRKTTPAKWIVTWSVTHVGDGSLTLGGQETPTAGLPMLNRPIPKKDKPSRLLWTGTNSMKRSCVNGVEITCKSIIMANCVAGVGRFLP